MSTGILVIPCYNEAERLHVGRFREFVRAHRHWQLLMVNDGSTDATLPLLRELASSAPGQILVCDLVQNRGKAEAVRRGTLEAIERGPDYVGFLDADLATPLSEIARFQDVLDRRPEIEIIVGTRLPLLGRNIARRRARSLLGRAFGMTASRMLGLPLYDTQCGAKVFRVTDETAALFAQPFHSRWIFDVELFARLVVQCRCSDERAASNVLYELPLEEWHEVSGSKLRSKDFFRAAFELLLIYWRYFVRQRNRTAKPSPVTMPTAKESGSPTLDRRRAA
jgi:glycosyltransferase involved in cell wall biosynthesis